MSLMCLGILSVQAQITTGESTSRVIRTGNRAQAGNFGIYFGMTTDMFKNLSNGGPDDFSCMPLINLKYMKTDNLEYRLGFEWWKQSDSSDNGDNETSESESSFMFYPGVAYHFNRNNLLDVYVGGELPLGFGSKGVDYGDDDASASQFKVGLGACIGLQAYIASLPIAIGAEYGVSTLYNHVGDGTMTKDGMTIERIQEDVSQSQWKIGHQVRVTLSYYFNL